MSKIVTINLEGELGVDLKTMDVSYGGFNLSAIGDASIVDDEFDGDEEDMAIKLSYRVSDYFANQAKNLDDARLARINDELASEADMLDELHAELDEEVYEDGVNALMKVLDVIMYLKKLDSSMHVSVPEEMQSNLQGITDYIEKATNKMVSS